MHRESRLNAGKGGSFTATEDSWSYLQNCAILNALNFIGYISSLQQVAEFLGTFSVIFSVNFCILVNEGNGGKCRRCESLHLSTVSTVGHKLTVCIHFIYLTLLRDTVFHILKVQCDLVPKPVRLIWKFRIDSVRYNY